MKILKKIVVLSFCLAALFKPQKIAQSTCGIYLPDYYSYDFFDPITFDEITAFSDQFDETAGDNLSEWHNYFDQKPSKEDIGVVVYGSSADDLQKIRAYVQNTSAPLSAQLKSNSLVKYWQANQDLNTIDYIFYAKVCEPQAAYYDEWSDQKRDPEQMRWLANAGKKYYSEKAHNTFLKLRFAYQAIRMAHYVGEYQKAVNFYDELVQPLLQESNSIIAYWALAHKAGALTELGNQAEAAYLFVKVFKDCPSKRASSFRSFQIHSDQQWSEALDLCQDMDEKIELYFIRSLDRNANGLEEMKQVYSLAPQSDRLSIMLVREINKLENALLNINVSSNLLFYAGHHNYPDQEAIQYLMNLKSFIGKCLEEKQISDLGLWSLADGYLEYIAGNPQRALSVFAKLKKDTKNKAFKNQIELFELAIQITRLTKIDDQAENEIYKQVKVARHKHMEDFMIQAFARLYDQQGQRGKAYLCRNDISSLRMEPKLEVIDALITLSQKSKLTAFEEEYLFPKIQYDYLRKDKVGKPLDVLLEMKATLLFQQDRLKEAVSIYEQIPDKLLYTIEDDPFQANIHDCLENCPPSSNRGKYNRKTLAMRVIALKELVKRSPVDQAKYYFDLGSAYYNMTYFGNSWMAVDYFRSSADLWHIKNYPDESKDMLISLDCSKAKYYFDRAMNASIKMGDLEMAAKSCYMAAKCEQNQYYLKPSTKASWSGIIPPDYSPENRRYFNRLKQEFKETNYYDRLIQECLYFNTFVRQ